MDPDPEAEASRYRREAEHLRRASELIADERLREQLIGIAQQYEAAAASLQQELPLRAGTPAGP